MKLPHLTLREADDGNTYYLELRDHPHEVVAGVSKKTVALHGLIEGYDGPAMYLDLDANNRPIGIEILYPTPEP